MTSLGAEPAAQVANRVAEARHCEEVADEAVDRLGDSLHHGLSGDLLQAGFDRVEAAGWELERRALTARDVLAVCPEQRASAAEIDRLQLRARALVEYVQTHRQADTAGQLQGLAVLSQARPPSGH
jgi:hypothetical protein